MEALLRGDKVERNSLEEDKIYKPSRRVNDSGEMHKKSQTNGTSRQVPQRFEKPPLRPKQEKRYANIPVKNETVISNKTHNGSQSEKRFESPRDMSTQVNKKSSSAYSQDALRRERERKKIQMQSSFGSMFVVQGDPELAKQKRKRRKSRSQKQLELQRKKQDEEALLIARRRKERAKSKNLEAAREALSQRRKKRVKRRDRLEAMKQEAMTRKQIVGSPVQKGESNVNFQTENAKSKSEEVPQRKLVSN